MKRIAVVVWVMLLVIQMQSSAGETISLAGDWGVRLDVADAGIKGVWNNQGFEDKIKLPGSLPQRGYGNDPAIDSPWTGSVKWGEWDKPQYAPYKSPENFKMPFWLQPDKIFVGAAWYQKEVKIPKDWKGKHIVLHLERPHWETKVWVDKTEVSTRNSLSTPHEHDLSKTLTPGRHRITIRVDNRMIIPVGVNSHSVSDHTQSNWNGLVGKLELRMTEPVWIDDVQVFTNPERKTAEIKLSIGNITRYGADAALQIEIADPYGKSLDPVEIHSRIEKSRKDVSVTVNLGSNIMLWDEFDPNLYSMKVSLSNGDYKVVKFGLRKFETAGTQFVVNRRKTFMRGTLECAIFPLTGYPPTGVDYWRKIVSTCKAHGLNHIRFHSWCPPDAAFVAADELGFYYQVECAAWANGKGSGLGKGLPVDEWLYDEGRAITKAYGNHPSFMLMAYGNEPGGKHQEYLAKWCTYWKERDPRRLYTSGAGWPVIAESDYNNSPRPRIQGWGEGLRSIINSKPPRTDYDWSEFVKKHADKPTISHEIGQWCVYPDFDEIKKYTGVLKAENFEIFRELLANRHMSDQAHDFLMASGKLQTLCYKADIEAALRTDGFGGFQLLDLHDFPGQGTALVGVLDPFWDSKPYVTPENYSRFCNATVPLALMSKRTFKTSEDLDFKLEVVHYGETDLRHVRVWWKLKDVFGRIKVRGHSDKLDIKTGGLKVIGNNRVKLRSFSKAQQLKLEVGISGTDFINSWNVWVYPDSEVTYPTDILLTHALDKFALGRLKAGGKVMLMVPPSQVETKVKSGFSSIFWNTAWTGGQAPHTLGILCDPKHPALEEFPTEYHSDWQWWDIVTKASTMEMDNLPTTLRPIVQVVPDWFDPKRLGLIFEAKLNGGKLMVCSVDLEKNIHSRPAASQLRRSILAYMESDKFQPSVEISAEQVQGIFRKPSFPKQLVAAATADAAEPGHEAAKAIDGNPNTMWHTPWHGSVSGYPINLL